MKKSIYFKAILIAVSIYFSMIAFRLYYGYVTQPNLNQIHYESSYSRQTRFSWKSKNYISGKGGKSKRRAPDVHSTASSQRYEKVGSAVTESKHYEKDKSKVIDIIKSNKAIIQFEQSSGLKGNRFLSLGIGVNPDQFENMIASLEKVGKLVSFKVTKTDKTNDYLELKAKRKSLEKTREALTSLRGKGKVEKLILLENRILEIERDIQSLGVELGEFDNVNEFCTVKLSLYELKKIKVKKLVSMMHRGKVAFQWATAWYLKLVQILIILGITLVIMVLLLEKFKIVHFNEWKYKLKFISKNTSDDKPDPDKSDS